MSDYQQLAATHYENFPVGSVLVPRAQRRHMHRIYAFARTADDLADELRDAEALAAMRADFDAHLAGDVTGEPVPLMADLVRTIEQLSLPPQLFFDLLDAFALDLELLRHDRASLMAYCTKSADPVGRLVLRVFGHENERMDLLSDRICTALQLVNHLQDIREDLLERDRIYLPKEDLAEHGVTEEDLRAESASPGVRAVVELWTDKCAVWFQEGWELTGMVRGRLGPELRAILRGAARVIWHLRRLEYDTLSTHIRLSRRERLGTIGRALFSSKMPGEFV